MHLSSPAALERHYAEAAPQKDCLCGAFWGALALRCGGIATVDGQPADQDLVAVECGVTLDAGDPYASLPPCTEPRLDYRVALPIAADSARSGTSARSLRAAISRCSDGALAPVPVRGPWSDGPLIELFRLVERHASGSLLIANLRTGLLWGSRPTPAALLSYLAGDAVDGPAADWNVGHYVALQFAVVNGERALIGVLDTYPSLGWDGHHLQPATAVARALAREDEQAEGGILCAAHYEQEPPLREALEEAGYTLSDWDNGSDSR